MPAGGGAAATQLAGGPEVIDLKVCMSLLKKTIVFFPLLIMVVIFLVKAYLTTDVKTAQLLMASSTKSVNETEDIFSGNSSGILTSDEETMRVEAKANESSSSLNGTSMTSKFLVALQGL